MKKLILVLLFAVSTLAVQAQNTSIGLRTGVNISNFGGEDGDGKGLLGANFGAFGTYSVSQTFGTTLEINYMMKGAKDARGADAKATVNYLEIPLYANFFFGSGGLRPKIFAGPTIGFLMDAKTHVGDNSTDASDAIKGTEFGATIGAGCHFKISTENWLIVDLRYGLGLSDISEADGTDIKNNVFSVNVGVSFPLGNY